MPFASSNGARIHYTVHGEQHARGPAPTAVLLQGLGLSSRYWFDVPERLASDPGSPRRVIAIDNRGTGRTEQPRGPWTMAGMADDVIAVLDQAAVDTAVVVGISMGGMIAQHVALRHPARVRGLVLLATSAGVSMAGLPEPATLLRLLSLPFGGAGASVNLGRLLLPPSKWHRAKEIFHDWPAAANEHPTHPRTFAMHLFAASTHLVASRLHEIQCAALVVAGELDSLLPIANSRVLARKIPRGELEIIPDAGHAIFAEDRDLVRRLLLRLERMDSP